MSEEWSIKDLILVAASVLQSLSVIAAIAIFVLQSRDTRRSEMQANRSRLTEAYKDTLGDSL